MPARRAPQDIRTVRAMTALGLTDRDVSRRTDIPITTIRKWRRQPPRYAQAADEPPVELCPECGSKPHDFASLPQDAYAYLLGVYLGDGCLTRNGTSWTLRIVLDKAYPGIVEECCDAIAQLRAGVRPHARPDTRGQQCLHIEVTWRPWRCLFPQHGPGRKHRRRISLAEWQPAIVDEAPGPFLRGLIHTDGWRGLNRVHVKGKAYAYPRYQFSNRSDDIRRIFTDACDTLGVSWSRWTRYHISVAQRDSVALLDSFVGPKT